MAKSDKSDPIAFLVGQTLLVILLAKGTFTGKLSVDVIRLPDLILIIGLEFGV